MPRLIRKHGEYRVSHVSHDYWQVVDVLTAGTFKTTKHACSRYINDARRLIRLTCQTIDAWNATLARYDKESSNPLASRYVAFSKCLPSGTRFADKTIPWVACKSYAVCPYCWGRHAASWWSRLDSLLFPVTPEGNRPARSVCSVGFAETTLVASPLVTDIFADYRPALAAGFDLPFGWQVLLDSRSGRLKLDPPVGQYFWPRKNELSSLQNRGKSVATVETVGLRITDKQRHAVDVRQLHLFVRNSAGVVPVPRHGTVLYSYYPSISREQLVDLVVSMFPYPAGLLETPAQFAVALALREGRQFLSTSGALRKAREGKTQPDYQ